MRFGGSQHLEVEVETALHAEALEEFMEHAGKVARQFSDRYEALRQGVLL